MATPGRKPNAPEPFVEAQLRKLVSAGAASSQIQNYLSAIAQARRLIRVDREVNLQVVWKGRESQPGAHPFGTSASPKKGDVVTIDVLAEKLAPYTRIGREAIFDNARLYADMRGFNAIDARFSTDPTRVYLLNPPPGSATREPIAVVEDAFYTPSSLLLAAHSFSSMARNVWTRAEGQPSRFRELERAFWRTALKLVDESVRPPRLMIVTGRRVVQELDDILRARHPLLRAEDRRRIAVRLGQLVGLEKAGDGDLAERARRRRYRPGRSS